MALYLTQPHNLVVTMALCQAAQIVSTQCEWRYKLSEYRALFMRSQDADLMRLSVVYQLACAGPLQVSRP